MSRFILGVTGASGAIYAARTAMYLKQFGHNICGLVTPTAKEVVKFEGQGELFDFCDTLPDVNDFFAECASGSADYSGMVVEPCSMGTLGRIAHGTSDNLLVRSADVCLKERRPLVIVPREMPYNLIHLKNMETLSQSGAVVVPASPQFYSRPQSIEALVDTVVVKVLKHLGIPQEQLNAISKPWDGCGTDLRKEENLC